MISHIFMGSYSYRQVQTTKVHVIEGHQDTILTIKILRTLVVSEILSKVVPAFSPGMIESNTKLRWHVGHMISVKGWRHTLTNATSLKHRTIDHLRYKTSSFDYMLNVMSSQVLDGDMAENSPGDLAANYRLIADRA
ncbi:hypothetical protein EDD15DRAFT_2193900 [Pisolithus albus]|nr:hypothetical protein EDD15DRAFT_2193900 [Pisolithus albus]